MSCPPIRLAAFAIGAILVLSAGRPAHAQNADARAFFKQNCMSCHTIGGGRLTGPDLKGVLERQERAWLKNFLLDPIKVLTSGDPYAAKLQQEARGAVMPPITGMNPTLADALLDLIGAESKLPRSEFAGVQVSETPLTAEDATAGFELFIGLRSLTNGGAACFSCHHVDGVGKLGGGRLGPDLTGVYDRMQGRKGLTTWLAAPPTTTMKVLFGTQALTEKELDQLVAFFQANAARAETARAPEPFNFILVGLVGTVLSLLAFDVIWRRRFRSVRAALVSQVRGGLR